MPNNGHSSGKVARVDLATFSRVQVLDLTATDADLRGFCGGFASGGYGYVVPNYNQDGYFGKVARFATPPGPSCVQIWMGGFVSIVLSSVSFLYSHAPSSVLNHPLS